MTEWKKKTFEEKVEERGTTEIGAQVEIAIQLKRIADVLHRIDVSVTELTTHIINQR